MERLVFPHGTRAATHSLTRTKAIIMVLDQLWFLQQSFDLVALQVNKHYLLPHLNNYASLVFLHRVQLTPPRLAKLYLESTPIVSRKLALIPVGSSICLVASSFYIFLCNRLWGVLRREGHKLHGRKIKSGHCLPSFLICYIYRPFFPAVSLRQFL